MNKIFMLTLLLSFSLTQTACNNSNLNSAPLSEKFIKMADSFDQDTVKGSLKTGYGKAGIPPAYGSEVDTGISDTKEIQVNPYGTGNGHTTPVVAMNNNNNVVVTWKQQSDIFAQRYDSKGIPQGKAFMVNAAEHIIYNQKKSPEYINTMNSPKVAIDNKGNFIVVWERLQREFNQVNGVSVNSDIFARSYDSNGLSLSGEFKVNDKDEPELQHKSPAIARNSNGEFIITWSNCKQDGSSGGIYGRRYEASGFGGNQFLVTGNIKEKAESSVAVNSEGKFIIIWLNSGDNNIYARFFQNNVSTAGSEFRINNSADGEHGLPGVAMDKAGNFVITWQKTSNDGSIFGVFARKYNNMAIPAGTEFRVNSSGNNPYDRYEPAIAMNSNGNFVITWQNLNQNINGEAGIFAQKFTSSGSKLGSEFLVKTYSGVEETEPSAAIDSSNNFVITWADAGIHAKIFDSNNF